MYLKNIQKNELICRYSIDISNKYLSNYYKACEISEKPIKHVHPSALATLALKKFLEIEPIPQGAIHTAQEIIITKIIKPNSKISCSVFLDLSKEIRNKKIVVIETKYFDNHNQQVASSKGTLLVPS